MGSNPKQAMGFTLFMSGFTLITAGFATGGNLLLLLAGVVLTAASVWLFLKIKPLEEGGE